MSKPVLKGLVGVLVWGIISVGILSAAIDEIPQDVEVFIQTFFQKLTSGEAEAAVRLVESKMANPDESTFKRQSLILDLTNIEKLFGKYAGSEKLYSEYRGKDLLEVRYLYKGENAPLVFYFNFYKPKEKWLLDMIYWDRKPEALFDDD